MWEFLFPSKKKKKWWELLSFLFMIMKIPRILQLRATPTILRMGNESIFFAQTAVSGSGYSLAVHTLL